MSASSEKLEPSVRCPHLVLGTAYRWFCPTSLHRCKGKKRRGSFREGWEEAGPGEQAAPVAFTVFSSWNPLIPGLRAELIICTTTQQGTSREEGMICPGSVS